MSVRMYGLMTKLVSSVQDKEQRQLCASAIRLSDQPLSLIANGEYRKAIQVNDEVLKLLKGIPGVEILRALTNAVTGMAYYYLEQHDESLRINKAALPVLLSHPDFANEAATCLNIIGGSFLCQGNALESIKAFEAAIGIWSRIPGSEHKISDCNDNLKTAKKMLKR
jgi:tetratricopeptide (TPR) repeat protein